MIDYQNIVVEDIYTEGFLLTQTAPLSLSMTEGKLHVLSYKTKEVFEKKMVNDVERDVPKSVRENFDDIKEYPAFILDVEPDEELQVVYDVFLLSENADSGFNIHIDRTEMNEGKMPMYEGETPLLHTLLTFIVPPQLKDLSEINFTVRNMVLPEGSEYK